MSAATPVQQHASESGGSEARIIKEQLQRGEFTQLRKLLAQTQEKHDWQDRFFMLDLAAGHIATDRLEALCAQEPEAADLALIRGVNLFDLVYKSRGAKVADQTSKEQFEKAARFIKEALPALQRAAQVNQLTPPRTSSRCACCRSFIPTIIRRSRMHFRAQSPWPLTLLVSVSNVRLKRNSVRPLHHWLPRGLQAKAAGKPAN